MRTDQEAGGNAVLLMLARLTLGAIFVLSGYGKLRGFEGFAASLTNRGVPMAQLFGVLGVAAEFGGGLAVVLGFMTRYAALLMIAFIIVATGIAHRFWEVPDPAAHIAQMTNFMKNLSMLGGFLLLFAMGGGKLSLDGIFRK
jgi:putative oxidoreductase